MFTAMILVCASGMSPTPDTCFTYVHENIFNSYNACKVEIADALTNYPFVFEFYDESTDTQWKVEDLRCIDWKQIKA